MLRVDTKVQIAAYDLDLYFALSTIERIFFLVRVRGTQTVTTGPAAARELRERMQERRRGGGRVYR